MVYVQFHCLPASIAVLLLYFSMVFDVLYNITRGYVPELYSWVAACALWDCVRSLVFSLSTLV